MLKIIKASEPNELITYRSTPNATYNGWPGPEIRKALLIEQGYLCAYCMDRITDVHNQTKIDHIISRHDDRALELTWTNLVLCCTGSQGSDRKQQHCDSHKGNKSLQSANPLSDKGLQSITFHPDGTISSSDNMVLSELEDVLNLNHSILKANRRSVLKACENMGKRMEPKYTIANVTNQLDDFKSRDLEGKFKPYAGVAIYYWSKRLEKLNRRS